MTLLPEVLTLYVLDALFILFATVAFFLSVKIVLKYDVNSTASEQYILEKQSYLSAMIIKYIFAIKVPLFIFFIFTLDKISVVLPGAMCGAGVINATDYGVYLLVLKVLNLYLFAYWIVLHEEDMKIESQPYIKLKFFIFIIAFFLLMVEIIVEIMMFNAIDIKSVVDCCGAIFSSSENTYMAKILSIDISILLFIFYTNFIFLIIAYLYKSRYLYSLINLVFLIISLITLISFFGIYIYEMPMHHCPFCFLQKEYNYIGYILYILLFVGTFYGIVLSFVDFKNSTEDRYYKISILFNAIYVFVVTYYPLSFYLKNGVLM